MTQRSCRACGGWHDIDETWPEACYGHFRINHNRSDLSAPTIIKDGIDAVQSQLTGKWYESKSSLRTEYKAHNVIELGNEAPKATPEVSNIKVTKDEIGRAYQKVREGYKPSIHSEAAPVSGNGLEWY